MSNYICFIYFRFLCVPYIQTVSLWAWHICQVGEADSLDHTGWWVATAYIGPRMYRCIDLVMHRLMEVKLVKDVWVLMFWASANIYVYLKRNTARARYQLYFDPDSLLLQCKKYITLTWFIVSTLLYNVESKTTFYWITECYLTDLHTWGHLLLRQASPWLAFRSYEVH